MCVFGWGISFGLDCFGFGLDWIALDLTGWMDFDWIRFDWIRFVSILFDWFLDLDQEPKP